MKFNFSSLEVEGDDVGDDVGSFRKPRRIGRDGWEFGKLHGRSEPEEEPTWRRASRDFNRSRKYRIGEAEFGAPVDGAGDDVIDIAPVDGPTRGRSNQRYRLGSDQIRTPPRAGKVGGLGETFDDEIGRICPDVGFDDHLDHERIPYPTDCYPVKANSGLPKCTGYATIPTSTDPVGNAKQYCQRFFHVAVKWGLKMPEESSLQRMFNCSAAIYEKAWHSATEGVPIASGEGTVIWMIGAADRNMALAFRFYESGNENFQLPWDEIPEWVQDVARPVDTPPIGTGKSRLPKVAAAMAFGFVLFALFGRKSANKRDPYALQPPMSGLDDDDDDDEGT